MKQEEVAAKLAALMTLAFEVNSRTKYAVFCDYSGHVNSVRLFVGRTKEDYNDFLIYETSRLPEPYYKQPSIDDFMDYLNVLLEEEDHAEPVAADLYHAE